MSPGLSFWNCRSDGVHIGLIRPCCSGCGWQPYHARHRYATWCGLSSLLPASSRAARLSTFLARASMSESRRCLLRHLGIEPSCRPGAHRCDARPARTSVTSVVAGGKSCWPSPSGDVQQVAEAGKAHPLKNQMRHRGGELDGPMRLRYARTRLRVTSTPQCSQTMPLKARAGNGPQAPQSRVGPKICSAEQTVLLRLQRTAVDGFRFLTHQNNSTTDVIGGGKADANLLSNALTSSTVNPFQFLEIFPKLPI